MAKKKNRDAPREYTCPYCFRLIDLDALHWMCTGANCARTFAERAFSTRNEEDMRYVSRDGRNEVDLEQCLMNGKDPAGPDAIITRRHIIRNKSKICDVCGRITYYRACPICHNDIPPGVEEHGNTTFIILGPKGSGKSHYMAVLINQLKNRIAKEFSATLNAANDSTSLNYRDKYHETLFQKKRILPPTESLSVSDSSREALVYHFRLFDQGKVYTIVFMDTAGEDLGSIDSMNNLNLSPYISMAAGIIYLVDPLQMDAIRNKTSVKNLPQVTGDAVTILDNISRIIRTNKQLRSREKVDIPIAVTLTKCDVLMKPPVNEDEATISLPPCSAVRIPRRRGEYDAENFEQIDIELEEYCRRHVGDGFIQAVNGFEKHAFFAVSALGNNPSGLELTRGITPIRVEDPLLWLLHMEETNEH
ncbi:MAG: hypothetical protein IKD00_05025 [Candidatus Methanomethylophilaceae archaeon]|nr:hypothetical protein [Candidatus Methanomethylophilaceae archaeon]